MKTIKVNPKSKFFKDYKKRYGLEAKEIRLSSDKQWKIYEEAVLNNLSK